MNAAQRTAARTHAARTTKLDVVEIRATRALSTVKASPLLPAAAAVALVVLGSIKDFPMP